MVQHHWQDDAQDKPYQVPDDVQDLVFRISARSIPLDHAHALSGAILKQLPWMDDEPEAGIHLIHGAESGNGWQRPQDPDTEVLHLSRRARMSLRLPKHRIEQARTLTGQILDIDGHPIAVGDARSRPLVALTTIFSRHVMTATGNDEEQFVEAVVSELCQRGITVRKLLCGREHYFRLPAVKLSVRSIMLADLDVEHSVRLQQRGLGAGRTLGCGLFLPHKGVASVSAENRR
jgi:CRISPR-associated protein Cas6